MSWLKLFLVSLFSGWIMSGSHHVSPLTRISLVYKISDNRKNIVITASKSPSVSFWDICTSLCVGSFCYPFSLQHCTTQVCRELASGVNLASTASNAFPIQQNCCVNIVPILRSLPWTYQGTLIQRWRHGPVHCYQSCSVTCDTKNV